MSRLPFRWRVGALMALVVAVCGGVLLLAAHALMAAHLHRTLPERAADAAAADLGTQFALVLAGATLGAATLAWLLAGRALAPLRRVADAARGVSPGTLDGRVALDGPRDELREVADSIDGMLERLSGAFAAQQRFVGHAAHELRRPLTAMRAELDVTLADPSADAAELRRMGDALSRSVDRCTELVAALLTLARGEAVAVGDDVVDLAALARTATGTLGAAETGGATISAGVPATGDGPDLRAELRPAPVRGDRRLLERLVENLVENAVRHGTGAVEVRTAADGSVATLRVANAGPVLAPDAVDALLEPFVRGEGAAPGSGLGLAIVRTIARAHGGTVDLRPRAGGGLVAEVVLPRSVAASPASRPPAARAA